MNKKPYSQILDLVARDHVAEQTDLAPRILAQVQKGKTMRPRTKVFVTAVLVLVVLAIVLANVPAVRAAIQRWIGYIPNAGLVSEGQIRTLAEPVSMTRDGITLTVKQVIVDSSHTTVIYAVAGLTEDILDYKNPAVAGCMQDPVLRLPGADLSASAQRRSAWNNGYELQVSYPAIPPEVNELKFVLPCILFALPDQAPENWELSLRLIPAPPEMTVFPIIEISTPPAETPTAAPQNGTGFTAEGISLSLDRAVQMDDGYLLYATLHWENTGLLSLDVYDEAALHLLDANGQEIEFTLDDESLGNVDPQPGQTSVAIKTAPIQGAASLQLILDTAFVSVETGAHFTFDPGPNPVPGQVWPLDQNVDLGNGHSLRILKVTYSTGNNQKANLTFEMESDTGAFNAMPVDREHPLLGGGGGGGGPEPGPFEAGFTYKDGFPEGPIIVSISSFSMNLSGPWKVQWTPPVSEQQLEATPQLGACLTRESWLQALQQRAPLPAGLSGTLALSDLPPPTYYYQVAVVRLDGSDLKSIGLGSWPSLSPDGTRVVYVGPSVSAPSDGLYITDLATGNTTRLPGTTRGDLDPLWSPDGQQIAFTRGPASGLIGAPGAYNIVVTNVDGSNFRQLTEGADASYAAAWMPDRHRLLYTVETQNGASLQILDIQTGEVSSLFEINYNGTVSVSPDGKRLAFEEMLPLDKYGLFVSNLDGSHRKLLADGDPYIVTIPTWSPDGNWIIASVQDPADVPAIPALIHVDTCQIIPLPNLSGYISSWIP